MKRDPNCQRCTLYMEAATVCMRGSGPIGDALIIGEAPGALEDAEGEPFIGESGQLLRKHMAKLEIKARITNAVRCRPPDNRTPKPKEIDACRPYGDEELAGAKVVLLLGATALQSVLGLKGIKKLRGKPIEQDGKTYLPAFHPSYILRFPDQEYTFEKDMRKFAEMIEYGGVRKEQGVKHKIVNTWDALDELLEALEGWVSFDVETTGLYPWHSKIVSLGFGTRDMQYVVPWDHKESFWLHSQPEVVKLLDERIQCCQLIMQNGKFDSLCMMVKHGVRWHPSFDTMLAHYLIDENDLHGLDHLAAKFFGAPDYDVPLEIKQGKYGIEGKHAEYLALDLYYTRKLKFKLEPLLNAEGSVRRVFDQILIPCSRLFTEIEYDGVYIDETKFDIAEQYLKGEIRKARAALEDTLEDVLDAETLTKWQSLKYTQGKGKTKTNHTGINWGSTKQLGELLFDDLGIKPLDKTDGGAWSTSESVLQRIDHPLVVNLLRFRAAKQQLSFFIEGWKPYLVDGYLHPSFKLTGTVTGRLSAEHPNLQQVPRDERIRQLITAPAGWVLIEADLSQIELRIAAEMSQDENLLYAFNNDIDVHWLTALRELERGGGMMDDIIGTACRLKGVNDIDYADAVAAMLEAGPDACVDMSKIWKEVRKKAKAINFGYLFGMWWKKFAIYARDNYGVTITPTQAQESRIAFFELYNDLESWHKHQKASARRDGYVESLSGRRRHLPDAMLRGKSFAKDEAERQGINAPVQSFANELNLMAALQLREEFGRDVVQICGTVHDAILARVKISHVAIVANRLLEIMRHPKMLDEFEIELSVPIEADLKVGPWGSGVSLKKWLAANDDEVKRHAAA